MNVLAFQIDIYAEGDPLPKVRHVFYGKNKQEAEVNFFQHCELDPMLRAAVRDNKLGGLEVDVEMSWREVPFDRKASRL